MTAAPRLGLFNGKNAKEHKTRLLAELKAMLLEAETYNVHDVLAQHAPGGATRDVREVMLLLYEAKEAVLASARIDFGPKSGRGVRPGTYERKTWLQTSRRATRQRRVGIQKQERALDRAKAAAETAPDAAVREQLERKADRQATSLEMARRRRKLVDGDR